MIRGDNRGQMMGPPGWFIPLAIVVISTLMSANMAETLGVPGIIGAIAGGLGGLFALKAMSRASEKRRCRS